MRPTFKITPNSDHNLLSIQNKTNNDTIYTYTFDNNLLSQEFFQLTIEESLNKCLIHEIKACIGPSNIGTNIHNNQPIYTSDVSLAQKHLKDLDSLINLLGIQLDFPSIYEIIEEAYLINEHSYRKKKKKN